MMINRYFFGARIIAICTMVLILSNCTSSKQPPAPPIPTPTQTSSNIPDNSFLPPINTPRQPIGKIVSVKNGVQYTAVQFSDLPDWNSQPFSGSLQSFRNSCLKLVNQSQWSQVCQIANGTGNLHAKSFFEQNFTPWAVSQNGNLSGTVTGYYEPGLKGSLSSNSSARFPIYGVPYDFVSIPYNSANRNGQIRISKTENGGKIDPQGAYIANLNDFPINERTRALKGRFQGNQFVPYYTRAQINAGALDGKAPILGYAEDAVELFFLQVQGSGRIALSDNQQIRLSYADKNDYPYVSIGRYMASKGYLPLGQTDMNSIKNYLARNPNKLAEVLGQNPSYVFFRRENSYEQGPAGALGVPLTAGFSTAVDRHYITLGSPIFVATTDPRNGRALNRLMYAQDTGSAITGAVRIDFFWGYGQDAGALAGKMKYPGYVWTLLPNGLLPQAE